MSSVHDDAPAEGPPHDTGERAASAPDDPAGAAALSGRVVAGSYTLEGLLGSGSIGRTFRARRSQDGHPVALKLVDPRLAAEPNFLRRLKRDVEAASKLEHRHIAKTFAQGVDEAEGAFICRELIDGEDLISAAKRAAMTPQRICELIMQVLSGLSEAHRHGVLHRNLKPQNVWVTRDAAGHERVVLCDFGNPQKDRAGAEYLAPEQADGSAIDGQADVYSVGVLLYELLTDAVPFRGESPRETLSLHKSAQLVPPRDRRPDRSMPRELEAVCVKALAKAPAARHRSPREMSQALRAVVSLLGPRALEPLGSSSFGGGSSAKLESLDDERLTMPGEQLRSRTKFWLGAGLLAAVCIGVILNPEVEPRGDPTARGGRISSAVRSNGELALERGIAQLRAGDATAAVPELRNARRALGDAPEVLRSLGEALVLDRQPAEGALLLKRYLELEPRAADAEFVRSLIERDERAR
ncbi:MAG: serine/threonine protein kinase [Myxococcaceae bacterium]|nr:serine/threonine protein kinase [Myxococcaceae bacterium]